MLKTGRMLTFYDILAFYDISSPGIHLRCAEKTTGSDLTAGPRLYLPDDAIVLRSAIRNSPNIIRIV